MGVSDLERSLAFYRDGLGWPTEGIVGTEFEGGAVAFFPLNNGVQLAIYPRSQIAEDANVADEGPFGRIHARAQRWLESGSRRGDGSRRRGRRDCHRLASRRAWGGYSGHFIDPDDHLWEVVWNPELEI
ncbi:VOC family protein [Salinigranum rubrum]|uniref:VOC family protein n=1 Tax=Salinigranum rubrum TaxID=755307 RepID=UPI0037430CAE